MDGPYNRKKVTWSVAISSITSTETQLLSQFIAIWANEQSEIEKVSVLMQLFLDVTWNWRNDQIY